MATEQQPPEGQATGNGNGAGRPALSAEQRARVATAVRDPAPQGGIKEQVESLVYVVAASRHHRVRSGDCHDALDGGVEHDRQCSARRSRQP